MRSFGRKQGIALGVIVAGAFLMFLGGKQGGYVDTLNKAIRICMECVGIG